VRARSPSCFIVVSLLVGSLAPSCPTHDRVCDRLAEPPHVDNEFPTVGDDRTTITNSALGSRKDVTVAAMGLSLTATVGSVTVNDDITSVGSSL